jgi:hypothetical protein
MSCLQHFLCDDRSMTQKQFTSWKSNDQNNHCSVGIGGRSKSNRHVG